MGLLFYGPDFCFHFTYVFVHCIILSLGILKKAVTQSSFDDLIYLTYHDHWIATWT